MKRNEPGLTARQRRILMTGEGYFRLGFRGFMSEAEAAEAWGAHRDELLELAGDGCKPWAWWRFEAQWLEVWG